MHDFDLSAFLPYQLAVAAARVSKGFADRYRAEFGLSIPEWRVLAHLAGDDAVSVREIHARVDMDKSKVSRAAARLEEAGLIEKRENAADRRLLDMRLTDKGRDLIGPDRAHRRRLPGRGRGPPGRGCRRLSPGPGAAVGGQMITLYDYWRSSASYRVRIALNLLGLDYRAVPVNLLEAAHKAPENLARNPQGLVPTLEIDGLVLVQSLAILEYLNDTRGGLLPADAAGKARVRAIADAIAMEIAPVCNLSVRNRVAQLSGGAVTADDWQRSIISNGFDAVERMLEAPQTGRFCHGDSDDHRRPLPGAAGLQRAAGGAGRGVMADNRAGHG
jgi:maleylacetoacetate isomerase